MDKTNSRSWFVTIQNQNIRKAGIPEDRRTDPKYTADFFKKQWEESGKDRTACVVACSSAEGVFHLHAALYGNTTTLKNVVSVMFDSHVEPIISKKDLKSYILKEGKYAEKGEKVLYIVGRENIISVQGKRSDLEEIEYLIQKGRTPREIFDECFSYRRYDKQISDAYIDQRIKNAPVRKNMHCEWHVGESGTGKTYTYEKLCEKYGKENIFFTGYMTNGWCDSYMEVGAPQILFIDELRPSANWQELLNVLDIYTQRSIHSRYRDIYPLWNQVYITSIYSPEEIYSQMINEDKRKTDSFKQLLRRLDTIVFHYVENGEYKEYQISANEYQDYNELRHRAFMHIS